MRKYLQNKLIVGTILLIFSAILYGLEPVIAKSLLREYAPMEVQFMRYIIAIVLLSPFLFIGKSFKRLTKKQIFSIILLGFLGMGIASPLFYAGLKQTSGLAAILIERSYPFLVFIFAYIFLKEKITIKKLFGVILVIFGTALIVFYSFIAQGTSTFIGNLIILGAMIVWSVWIILAKILIKNIEPLLLTASGFIVGLPFVILYQGGAINLIFTFRMFVLGIIVALSWLLYFKGLKYITAMKATIIEASAPFFTAIFTFLILTKIPDFFEILAIFLVVPGLILISSEK